MKSAIHRLGRSYVRLVTRSEAEAQRPLRTINERPAELVFVFECVRDLVPKTILDVGSGQSPLPALLKNCGAHVTAIDNVRDYWHHDMVNRHWHVIDDDIRRPRSVKPGFDLITCISVIEHIPEHIDAFRSMMGLLKSGGHLIVTMPYHERRYVDDVYKLPGAQVAELGYTCRSSSRATIEEWLAAAPATIERQEFWRYWTGDVWRQGEQLPRPERSTAEGEHQIGCFLFRKP
jgi:SAM-dependent methyltransferase